LFAILPAATTGCLGCVAAGRCAAQAVEPAAPHSWTEKADFTWEDLFRFAYRKDLIPVLKALSAEIGNEKFLRMLRDCTGELARKKMAGAGLTKRDLATFVAGMKTMPPLFQHALEAEILEDTPAVFEFRISRCLWAKTFRQDNAADLGYAIICHPDFGVAAGYNPKLKLTRPKTLMQGDDCCHFRYEMEA
jgi:hypothetical protein